MAIAMSAMYDNGGLEFICFPSPEETGDGDDEDDDVGKEDNDGDDNDDGEADDGDDDDDDAVLSIWKSLETRPENSANSRSIRDSFSKMEKSMRAENPSLLK